MKNKKLSHFRPKFFIVDVDGVFTDGKFYYTSKGKVMKKYGPDDSDAITFLKGKLKIHTLSGDKRGFKITKRRMDDMKLPCDLVSTFERIEWIKEKFDPKKTIFMGDGIFDGLVFKQVGYSIAPANAFFKTKELADYVTQARGSEGAVAEAVLHILEKFFAESFDLDKIDFSKGRQI